MFFRLIIRLLCPALLAAAPLQGVERNGWPFFVRQEKPDGTIESAEYLVPFLFRKASSDGVEMEGFRPFLLRTREGPRESTMLFYPFFTWQREDGYRSFSFFQLINIRRETEPANRTVRSFDVWPFYFSRDSGNPVENYRALFPICGTIKHRFGYDQIHFVLFPFYADTENRDAHTTHAPWPFLRFIHGDGHHGFEFWPLFGHRGRAGDYDDRFYLWPLIYRSARDLAAPVPDVKLGVLPFYARDTAAGYVSETYVWPFFGYTHRTEPYRYDEQRYLWPFLVQGHGDDHQVNRWAPFYTHSVIKGYDKTWFAWPIFRHARWEDQGLIQEQSQVVWFLYWSLTQRSATNPAAAPAHKTHLWPLLSSWNNGAGQRQLQLLSPFEVFFPTNEPIRQLYTPLFALYRFDQRAPNDTHHSLFFSLISWGKSPEKKEFHLGPLFSLQSTPGRSRIALGRGLLAWQRRPGVPQWKFSLFDFRRKPDNNSSVALSP